MASYLTSHLVSIVTACITVALALHLFSTRRTSQSLLAWLIALVFVPPVAIPLYVLFSIRKRPARPCPLVPASAEVAAQTVDVPIARVLTSSGLPAARRGNAFALLATGEEAYARLLALIATAARTIDLSVFILGDDEVGTAVVEALAARARGGVRVRLIVDAVGSRTSARRARRTLAAAGGELRVFMPLLRVPFSGVTNLRSHRKVALFDGERLFTGGMNVASEYMGPAASPTRWRDVAAVATGPVARDTAALFQADWEFCGGAREALPAAAPEEHGEAVLQSVWSGPDVSDDALYDALLTALHGARERIVIVTPYYVPDEPMHRALLIAARRGVKTTLVMPARSNHYLADIARRGLLVELRAAGVELWAYERGMVHAKAMAVDSDFAFVGSPNLDMRSLYLNYENALFVYSAKEVAAVAGFIEELRAESERDAFDLTPRFWLFEQLARLAAPEL